MIGTAKRLLGKLWNDDCGAILTTEYLLLGSVVALGGVSGMVAMRDSVNGELQEYGNSVRSMRQSYSVPGIHGGGAYRAGSSYADSAAGSQGAHGAGTACADCYIVP